MAIHGIVSTYFGDLEFDIGKSLNWTKTFCDTVYIMDINLSETSRQYVVNWDYSFPTAKHSFFSQYSFLSNPTNAKNWRKESFTRAKNAWNYSADDWVMFIDGTEGLNIFHAPPTTFDIDSVAISSEVGATFGTVTFTTATDHGAEVGNILGVVGASLTTTIDSVEVTISFDGSYEIVDVPSDTEISVTRTGVALNIVDTALDTTAHGSLTTEPTGYFSGDVFKCWIQAEIDAAIADGKNFISLDGWALIRSGAPTELVFDMMSPDRQIKHTAVATCEEYYVPMGSMIRLARVGSLNNPTFNWLTLDQPDESFANAYAAQNLSLISYAYVRWSDSPTSMTQAVDSEAPNYVDPMDPATPPLRPVAIDYDTGFAMRRLISQVRPLTGVPILTAEWSDPDPDGEQPLVDGYNKLDLIYVQHEIFADGEFAYNGYRAFGGSPLYPGILRSNLREGVWYTSQGEPPRTVRVVDASLTSGVVTVNTGTAHYLSVGTRISVYGTDSVFNGVYTIASVPTSKSFTYERPTDTGDVATTTFPLGQAVTLGANFGPVPWNYLLNTFGIDNPTAWIKFDGRTTV